MGIEISPKAEVPARGLLRRRPGRDQLFADIRQAVTAFVDDPLLARFLKFQHVEHTLNVFLHPAGPPLEFIWDPQGVITASVKTSTVGPGFHAFVVDLVEAVGDACNLRWTWADADETEYAITRNFDAIKAAMRSFLGSLAHGVLDLPDEMTNVAVSWSMDAPMPDDAGFSISCMGPFDRAWWEAVAEEPLEEHAAEFFAWWNQPRDAEFWKNLGMVLLWTEVPWHPPADEAEAKVCQLALDCFARTKELQPGIAVPADELEELEKLLKTDPDERPMPPRADGVGFRRGMMCFPATGSWTVLLPGYYYQRWDEESTQYTYWFGDRTIHCSSLSVEGKNIWKTVDAFHFLHRKVSGNLTLTADIEFVGQGKNAHRKAGWMIRQGLEADAAYVDVMVHGDGLIALQYRSKKGEATSGINAKIKAPATVRLERYGNTFTLLAAAKGEAFVAVGSVQVELADPVYAGLAACSHDPAVSETAVFSNVSLKNEAAKPAETPGK